MLSETTHLLDRLRKNVWFRLAGKPISEQAVLRPASWIEAIEFCSSSEWSVLQREAANAIRLRIGFEKLQRWNNIVEKLTPTVAQVVDDQTKRWVGIIPGFDQVVMCAQWDVMNACVEVEYGIEDSFFFHLLLPWYEQGHFPCGWGISRGSATLDLLEPRDERDIPPARGELVVW